MEYSFQCNERETVYKNAGSSSQSVHISVQENCGGNSHVTVYDAQHNVVSDNFFESPGGTITLTINPNNQVEIFCDGGTDPHGCTYEITF
jgi:hypothetical protein